MKNHMFCLNYERRWGFTVGLAKKSKKKFAQLIGERLLRGSSIRKKKCKKALDQEQKNGGSARRVDHRHIPTSAKSIGYS